VSPSAPSRFDLQGHRGARGLYPENTIPAFLAAVELGVDTVELDVVVTGDGRLVASHDPWFDPVICSKSDGGAIGEDEKRRYRIYALTYDEVARFDCGRRGHPNFPRQRHIPVAKPLLRDAIEAVEARVRELGRAPVGYNIETKSWPEGDGELHPPPAEFTRLLYRELVDLGVLDRTLVQSFDVRTLHAMRDLDPGVALSLLVENDLGLEANLDRLGFTPEVYSPDHRLVDAGLVAAAHARGMRVIPWTVNDPTELERMIDLNVDGVITDYPDLGREVVVRRLGLGG